MDTGSLVCLGCGHEHNCGVRGCAILREAADALERLNDFDQTQSKKMLEKFQKAQYELDDLEALHGLSGEQAGRVGGGMMKTDELVKRLCEYAEWARANEWEVPITLADALEAAADTIERLDNFADSQCCRLLEKLQKADAAIPRWISVKDRMDWLEP